MPIEGLRDLHALYACAPDLFPREVVVEVVKTLEPQVLDVLQKEDFYKQTAMFHNQRP